MLRSLEIENIILVKKAVLNFSGGLCVFTGETGAGKSIVLSSILTLLGKETKTKAVVRNDCKYGLIQGFFENISSEVEAILLKNALMPTKDISIKCITQNLNSTYFINNQQVSINIIREIGSLLIEVNRQHEQTHLMDEKNHITILDEYAGIQKELQEIAEIYSKIKNCEAQIEEITRKNQEVAKEIDYINETLIELKNAEIEEDEYNALQEKRIENKKKFMAFETLDNAQKKFESANIIPLLTSVNRMIAQIGGKESEDISENIDSICDGVNNLENAINNLLEKNFINISEIDKVEERFFYLQDLGRKYKIPPSELQAFELEMQHKLANFNKAEASVKELQNEKENLEKEYKILAGDISEKRKKSGIDLAAKINNTLSLLQMNGATFEIEISPIKMQKNGMDKIVFMIETNKNMGFYKLSKIASGGEISRIVLAIKAAIAHLKQIPCVIFDEIDTGISGKTSNSVGDVMLELAKSTQIIVITHQPQVAAKAHDHFRIIKIQEKETETIVEKLTAKERIAEIARLLSGENITNEAMENAKKLVGI